MDKKSFLNSIDFEDKNLVSNLYDKISLAEKTGNVIFSNEFLIPNFWRSILKLENNFGIGMHTFGIFQDSERRVIAFSRDIVEKYPISLVKITNKSKFNELKHKDYLGAIMSLGIVREKYGDMITRGNSIYVPVIVDICDFLVKNLCFVGKCPCSVEKIEDYAELDLTPDSQEFVIQTSSLRLDCIIASICNISRSKAVDMIDGGKVLLNYEEFKIRDKNVQLQDTITIRGYGKYVVGKEVGTTQKGRLKLLMKKYI